LALRVREIFYSIQGESSFAGRPCAFVRLSGCNLRCTWCDTTYAYSGGERLDLSTVEDRIRAFGCGLVEVTGGEPLLQDETPLLVKRLLDGGYRVLVETNGTQDIRCLDSRCIRVVDVKCPSSGEEKNNLVSNIGYLENNDEVKFVLADRGDYEYARAILRGRKELADRLQPPLLSPVHGLLDPAELARWILADGLDVRMQIQLHKVLWGAEKRGV
jgi:7-carboxy-7-deazaguanine synthase